MSENDRFPINAVSNLALLRAADNTRKGNKTFKEFWDAAYASGQITEDEHQEEIMEMATQLICPLDILPSATLAKSFDDFLLQRFDKLKQEFKDVWHDRIPNDQSNTTYPV